MQKIQPYRSLAGALRALDNGGRFYHMFTKAGDGSVTAAELKKAAGVFGDELQAALFFEMATSSLSETERTKLDAALGPEAGAIRRRHRPEWLVSQAFEQRARAGRPYILEGEVERIDDEQVTGMIFVPMMTGNVTTVMPIPITHQYTVYALRSAPGGASCPVLTPKQAVDLHGAYLIGGVAKEGEVGEGRGKRKVLRLEARYYAPSAG